MTFQLTQQDINLLRHEGIEPTTAQQQLQQLTNGLPWLKVEKAATTPHEILCLDKNQQEILIKEYEEVLKQNSLRIVKFVPASGAASRMFKAIISWLNTPDKTMNPEVENVCNNIKKFAFYNPLNKLCQEKYQKDIPTLFAEQLHRKVLELLLLAKGINLSNQPKGVLPFHCYDNNIIRTPIEEHIVETLAYATPNKGIGQLHLTISKEHEDLFQNIVKQSATSYPNIHVTFSYQKNSTNTLALDENGQPFRKSNGELLLRPGGHGALIENLSDIDGDIVFIKNIDNVVPDQQKQTTIKYKKILGGLLIQTRQQCFNHLEQLNNNPTIQQINEAESFVTSKLCITLNNTALTITEKTQQLRRILDRPLRVCGMVKNDGEPGGGPFLVKNNDGTTALQILESVQIEDKTIMARSTHFNPVDLVCSITNAKGEHYDLKQFVDTQAGFISEKSQDGKTLKALELPGLWNGAMSQWNTIMVEVPTETFAPVKTLSDLLRPQHQNNN